MIRYIALLTATLLLTVSCSGSSEPETAQVPASAATATIAQNTPTPEPLDLDPKISCVLNKEENQISCVSTNIQEGSQLKWTSTASYAHNGGSKWQFTINKQPVYTKQKIKNETPTYPPSSSNPSGSRPGCYTVYTQK